LSLAGRCSLDRRADLDDRGTAGEATVEQQWVEAMAAMHSGTLVSDDEETIPQQKYTL